MLEVKECTKCKKVLPICNFGKCKANNGGLKTICRKCLNKAKAKYREEHKEKIATYNKKYTGETIDERKKYYKENKLKFAISTKKYHNKNKEKFLILSRIYNKKNKDKIVINSQKQRAVAKGLTSTLAVEQWLQIKKQFNNKCAYCGGKKPLEIEHFIPSTKLGILTINNIIPACKSCNCSKKSSDFFAWYPKHKSYDLQREKIILKFLGYTKGNQQLKII